MIWAKYCSSVISPASNFRHSSLQVSVTESPSIRRETSAASIERSMECGINHTSACSEVIMCIVAQRLNGCKLKIPSVPIKFCAAKQRIKVLEKISSYSRQGVACCVATRSPANTCQVGVSKLKVEKKDEQNQTAKRFKNETEVGQRGVQNEIRSAPVNLDKRIPRRNKSSGICWQRPSCRCGRVFPQLVFCP